MNVRASDSIATITGLNYTVEDPVVCERGKKMPHEVH